MCRCRVVQQNDTVMLDIETGKIKDFIRFGVGNLCMITGGTNNGRVGTIVHQEHHKGSFEIIHIKDAAGTNLYWSFCACLRLLAPHAALPAEQSYSQSRPRTCRPVVCNAYGQCIRHRQGGQASDFAAQGAQILLAGMPSPGLECFLSFD